MTNTQLADLNGDGRTDILGANDRGAVQPVEWWKPLLLPQP